MIKALTIIIGGLAVLSLIFLLPGSVENPASQNQISSPTITTPEHYKATFAIYTNGVKRTFNQPMYYNLSEDVFIQATNPEQVEVRKTNLTWRDFFNTLPFTVTDQCLRTGTGETYCSGENGTLRFFLNGEEAQNGLDSTIGANERFVVVFGTPLPEGLR